MRPGSLLDGCTLIEYLVGNYKYQLVGNVEILVPELALATPDPMDQIATSYITLDEGVLYIDSGYAWDGASGPVMDRKSVMRASLVHDALYQLMRQDLLSREDWKQPADRVFQRMCIADGVWKWLAKCYYVGLKSFGRTSTLPGQRRELRTAP